MKYLKILEIGKCGETVIFKSGELFDRATDDGDYNGAIEMIRHSISALEGGIDILKQYTTEGINVEELKQFILEDLSEEYKKEVIIRINK